MGDWAFCHECIDPPPPPLQPWTFPAKFSDNPSKVFKK